MQRQVKSVITHLRLKLENYAAKTVYSPMQLPFVKVERCFMPSVGFYRFLYNSVGERYMWKDRRAMNDEALGEIIKHEDNHLYVIYYRGCPAGYAELNYRLSEEVELSYFGIIHEFVGKKLGPFLLHYIIQVAIIDNLRKSMIVNTCTLDHPSALSTYQKSGFEAYKTEEKMEPVPDWFESKH